MKPASFLPIILLCAASLHAQNTPPNQSANQSFGVAGMEGLGAGNNPTDQKLSAAAQKLTADLEHAVNRCPISMEARQGGGLHILLADKDGQATQPAMEPSLTLRGANGKRIASAAITAHGYGAPKGTTPLQTSTSNGTHDDLGGSLVVRPVNKMNLTNSPDQRPRLTHALTVRFQPDGDSEFSADFRLPGFVVLETISLNSITYADGSIENFDASICKASPSPIMLVSTTR
ncbi:hypothetical protein [Terracidiphilus sp.]|jgi:hypothetical protein|uniref:hypothetical protein n=1 Tax=Terracidiphilus sp. TaxID=1964191 RepID=UPI003C2032A6